MEVVYGQGNDTRKATAVFYFADGQGIVLEGSEEIGPRCSLYSPLIVLQARKYLENGGKVQEDDTFPLTIIIDEAGDPVWFLPGVHPMMWEFRPYLRWMGFLDDWDRIPLGDEMMKQITLTVQDEVKSQLKLWRREASFERTVLLEGVNLLLQMQERRQIERERRAYNAWWRKGLRGVQGVAEAILGLGMGILKIALIVMLAIVCIIVLLLLYAGEFVWAFFLPQDEEFMDEVEVVVDTPDNWVLLVLWGLIDGTRVRRGVEKWLNRRLEEHPKIKKALEDFHDYGLAVVVILFLLFLFIAEYLWSFIFPKDEQTLKRIRAMQEEYDGWGIGLDGIVAGTEARRRFDGWVKRQAAKSWRRVGFELFLWLIRAVAWILISLWELGGVIIGWVEGKVNQFSYWLERRAEKHPKRKWVFTIASYAILGTFWVVFIAICVVAFVLLCAGAIGTVVSYLAIFIVEYVWAFLRPRNSRFMTKMEVLEIPTLESTMLEGFYRGTRRRVQKFDPWWATQKAKSWTQRGMDGLWILGTVLFTLFGFSWFLYDETARVLKPLEIRVLAWLGRYSGARVVVGLYKVIAAPVIAWVGLVIAFLIPVSVTIILTVAGILGYVLLFILEYIFALVFPRTDIFVSEMRQVGPIQRRLVQGLVSGAFHRNLLAKWAKKQHAKGWRKFFADSGDWILRQFAEAFKNNPPPGSF